MAVPHLLGLESQWILLSALTILLGPLQRKPATPSKEALFPSRGLVTWEVCTSHLAEVAEDREVGGGWTQEGPPLSLHCEDRPCCHLWPDGQPV